MSIKNNYKLAHARVFGSAENLYQNFKNYRSVYDEAECTYLYAEFAFYNKKFDEANWATDISFKCFDTETESLICEMSKHYEITQDTNIFYAREGWGTPNPGWWKKGVYRWDAFIENELVGSTTFYIANLGLVTAQANPYLRLDALKLFGTHNGYESNVDARVYRSGFNVGTLNYLNVELSYVIHPTERPFPLEFQINYYNDAGLFKAALTYLKYIDLADAHQIADIAYGSATGGFWLADNYRVEVLFMGELLAVAHFNVGQSDVPHDDSLPFDPNAKVIVNNTSNTQNPVQNTSSKPPLPPKPTFEEATAALQKLIGLDSVKKQLDEFSTYLQFLQIRKKKGFEETEKFNMHTAFVGNPGTGKTTVAKMLGQIYFSLDLLSKGHVHEVGRADLVGEFIGQTAPKTQKAIEKARGGILFIDEAYALSDRGTSDNDFGKEVIECLLKEMSDGKGDIAVVFAGYPKQMKAFLESNPGMSSRISSTIVFPDYMPDELMQIAEFAANQKLIIFNDESKVLLHRKFVEYYRTRDKHFGNARFVHGVVEECKENMAIRLMRGGANLEEMDKDALSTVILEDVEKAFGMTVSKQAQIPIDEPMFAEALAELHALVGMPELKRQVDEMAKLVRYYTEIGRDVRKAFSLHTVFTGNPGTGKTTVARIITKIYKSLGILEKGHLIETDREGLVAGYVGQTAIKTNEAIESALGGCLFIDEAYALNEGKGSTYDLGGEAIDTLLKRMEDKRGEFMVIAAGYPEEMQAFLANNPGLLSRFDKTFHFTDYSEPELLDICVDMFEAESLVLSEEAVGVIQKYIAVLLQNKHKYFGNARTIRKIVKEVVQRQNLRLAHLPAAERTREQIRTVIPADIQGIQLMEQSEQPNRKMIGFGK